jgi:hypothetical protein
MPKIPTYISTSSITTETPSIQSNIKLNVNNTPASALQPVGDFLKDSYIKEKKLEADNKAYALLSDMYIDQKDANGNIVQKGLFTIQSETKNNGEPTNAAAYNDHRSKQII